MKITGVIIIFCFLYGCAGSPARTYWQAGRNTSSMLHLQPDMMPDEVVSLMGEPQKTEMYRGKNNEAILVYLYVTEGKDMVTRRWTEANYTPIVFENGKLAGWGWNYFNNTAAKYEFVIKDLY